MAHYIKHEMSEQLGSGKAFYRLATYSNFPMDDFVGFMERNEGLKESQIRAVIAGLTHQLANMLSMGHSVTIDGLGTFRISLGPKPGKEIEEFDSDESKRNAESIGVRKVLFKPDKGFVQMVDACTKLERGGERRIIRPTSTREERLQLLHSWLESHTSAHVADYMHLTGLNCNAATRELRAFSQAPSSGITTQGRRTYKVYVKSEV